MRRFLKMAGLGFLMGVAISGLITAAFTAEGAPVSEKLAAWAGSARAAMLIQYFASGVYGALCMGGVVLYDSDRLPLTLISFLHCLCCVVPFIPLSLILGWCTGAAEVLIMTGIQLAAYFVIWLIMYLKYRSEVKKMNDIQMKKTDMSEPLPPS